jgi:hypothetical protein
MVRTLHVYSERLQMLITKYGNNLTFLDKDKHS